MHAVSLIQDFLEHTISPLEHQLVLRSVSSFNSFLADQRSSVAQ